MPDLPSGTVTFLFTDLQGHEELWARDPSKKAAYLQHYAAIIQDAIEASGGYSYKISGGSSQAAFSTAPQALQAALAAQLASRNEKPGDTEDTGPFQGNALSVRMALHTGMTEERGDDYFGPLLNRAARLLSAGHGGQILLTQATAELVRDNLPEDVALQDLGEHHLKDLTRPERVYQIVTPGIRSDFPPLKTLEGRPNNLPLQPTIFVGRAKEVDEARELLSREDVWLLTLTGPGGIGKTRMALQVAAESLEEFSDGVFFVNLAPLADSRLVIPTIAYTLGLREAGGQPIADTLQGYLRDREMLLVLDNFEHVMDAAVDLSVLLSTAVKVKVLCTSRAPLRIRGERDFPVPPLSVPDPAHLPSLDRLTQYEAVSLFVERALAVKADFQVTNENAPAVAEICVRLDGLPLAIELAAARVRLFPPEALLARLSQRLKVLTGGARDLPARQQTLRNTIEWSYDLLEEGEKQLFRRMAVFQGGRTFEALEEVCNYDNNLQVDLLDGVESLVLKSLLQPELAAGQESEGAGTGPSQGGEPRFFMLETINEYARERLEESGEAQALARQHALSFMRLAEEVEPNLTGAMQQQALSTLAAEHDNLRAALQWAKGQARAGRCAESIEIGLRIAGALWRFWMVRGYFSEGREHLSALLRLEADYASRTEKEPLREPQHQPGKSTESDAETGAKAYRAKALHGEATLAWQQGDYAAARSLLTESLALQRQIGNKKGIANAVNNLGGIAYEQGDYPTARSLYEESLVLQRELGNKWAIAGSFGNLGLVALQQGDSSEARTLQETSLALHRELGDKRGIGIALSNLGLVLIEQGDYDGARSLYEESLTSRREIGDKAGVSSALNHLGLVALLQGDYPAAQSLYEESLKLRREMGDKRGIAMSLVGWSAVAVAADQVERGSVVLGAVEILLETLGAAMDKDDRMLYERAVASGWAQLGETVFEKLRVQGRAMSMDQALNHALENN